MEIGVIQSWGWFMNFTARDVEVRTEFSWALCTGDSNLVKIKCSNSFLQNYIHFALFRIILDSNDHNRIKRKIQSLAFSVHQTLSGWRLCRISS